MLSGVLSSLAWSGVAVNSSPSVMVSRSYKSRSSLVSVPYPVSPSMWLIDSITEDDLVSLDELQEKLAEFEDYVQSSDIAAMQSMYILSRFSMHH